MEELRVKVLIRLAEKALKELEEAYKRIPEVDNGKTYLFRGKERVRLMLNILREVQKDAIRDSL